MLRKKATQKQERYEIVLLEDVVPQGHILRKISKAIDFSFIHELCKDLYCPDNGRPAVEPTILFKMLFIGYLFGIKSETRLVEEIEVNMAYRWFLGYGLTDAIPNHATISINRVRRFRDNNIAEKIFDEILHQAQRAGLVGGNILYTDATHIKAKANKHKKELVTVEQTPKSYMEELDAQIDRDREVLGKKPFDRSQNNDEDPPTKTRMQSHSDPQSGQMQREGKPDGFHYFDHRTVDSKHNIIVNSHVTAANVADDVPLPEIIQEVVKRLGQRPEYMGLDAAYHNAPTAWLLQKEGIIGVLGYRRHTHRGDTYGKWRFEYDFEHDIYWCPQKKALYWKTTNRQGYREYYCDTKTCQACPNRNECLSPSANRRQVTRHVWQDWLDKATAFAKTPNGKRLYRWRKETIEPSFAESKENHGLRYARMVGIDNVREQCFLTDVVQNMKKMAKVLFSLFIPSHLSAYFKHTLFFAWVC